MSVATLRQIWLAIALVGLIVCLDFFAITQGWPVNFGTKLILDLKIADIERQHAPLYGLIAALPLLLLTFWLASIHAKRAVGTPAERFPFRLLDVDMATRDGRAVQMAAVFLLMILPLYAVGHFWRKLLNSAVCFKDGGRVVENLSIWTTDWSQGIDRSYWRIFDNAFRFAPTRSGCDDGPTFQPFLEPFLMAATTALALLFLYRTARAMWSSDRNR